MGPGVDPRYKVRMSTRTRLIVLFASVPVIARSHRGEAIRAVGAPNDVGSGTPNIALLELCS